MEKFRFLKWKVYADAKILLALILSCVKTLPKEYRFEFGSQIIRSAFSVVLNIAEGSGKVSDKELNRFLEIALGSVHETLAAADVLAENKFMTSEKFTEIYGLCEDISKQLGGFERKLRG